jgi:hypothetical protein
MSNIDDNIISMLPIDNNLVVLILFQPRLLLHSEPN